MNQEGNIKKEPLNVELEALEEQFRSNLNVIAQYPNQLHYDREYASLFRTRENAKKNIYARYGKNYKKKRYVAFENRNMIEYNNSYSNYPRPNEEQGFNAFENGANENPLKRKRGNRYNNNNNNINDNITNFPNPPTNNQLEEIKKEIENLPPNSQEGGKKRAKKTRRLDRKQRKTQRKRR